VIGLRLTRGRHQGLLAIAAAVGEPAGDLVELLPASARRRMSYPQRRSRENVTEKP
jgi:hypothetical protein